MFKTIVSIARKIGRAAVRLAKAINRQAEDDLLLTYDQAVERIERGGLFGMLFNSDQFNGDMEIYRAYGDAVKVIRARRAETQTGGAL